MIIINNNFFILRYRDQNMYKLKLLSEMNDTLCKPPPPAEIDDSDEDDTPTDTINVTQYIDESKSIQTETPLSITNKKEIITSNSESKAIPENIKNDGNFRGFLGATKNAIFRTAQSIIENHEKKSSKNKNDDKDENSVKSPTEITKKKEFFTLKSSSSKNKIQNSTSAITPDITPETESKNITTSISSCSLNKEKKIPGIAQCLPKGITIDNEIKTCEKGSHSGLLRFFESPIFNIHFAVHYLFYSKEPGVLSFIGNKIFSFANNEVDLYTPQLILMYIQMDELAEVLDPYLVYRCRKSVDFSLKCAWLLDAYNYNADEFYSSNGNKKIQLNLMKELYPKKEKKIKNTLDLELLSPIKKTHHRSQSDATGLLHDYRKFASSNSLTLSTKLFQPPVRVCLGDLTTGRSFDNGCLCFESVRGTVNGLLGHKTLCHCGVSLNF